MKKLNQLIKGIKIMHYAGANNLDLDVMQIHLSSISVGLGDLFIAQKGADTDGHIYIEDAVQNGANTIICESLPTSIHTDVNYLQVENSHQVAGIVASNFFDNPSEKINVIGITGTNGKTTIATLLYQLFQSLGKKTSLISTIENCIDKNCIASQLTTPDAISLNRFLSESYKANCEHVFMECSSHGISQYRINGVRFQGGIFSNLSHDHLDYHQSFATYRDVKKMFFDNYLGSDAFAIINIDDKNGLYMVQNTKAKIITYSLEQVADYKTKIISQSLENGMDIEINQERFSIPLYGKYNAYNIGSVYACAEQLNIEKEVVKVALSKILGAKGRMETVKHPNKNSIFIVDYAHTPDAIQNILHTVKKIKRPDQKLTVVLGCGGNRDASKRSSMGKIATMLSDKAIFTSDNPRSEDALTICTQMEESLDKRDASKVIIEPDRKQAIQLAVNQAQEEEIVIIAGKGHENCQIIGEHKLPFNDKDELLNAFNI